MYVILQSISYVQARHQNIQDSSLRTRGCLNIPMSTHKAACPEVSVPADTKGDIPPHKLLEHANHFFLLQLIRA